MRERVRHLRVSFLVSGVVLVAGALAYAVASGLVGLLGYAAGVALVVASYTASTVAIAWADSINPRMVFGVGMGMYVTKFSLFGFMMIAIGSTAWAGTIPFAIGIVAGVVAWTGTQIWWTARHQPPAPRSTSGAGSA